MACAGWRRSENFLLLLAHVPRTNGIQGPSSLNEPPEVSLNAWRRSYRRHKAGHVCDAS